MSTFQNYNQKKINFRNTPISNLITIKNKKEIDDKVMTFSDKKPTPISSINSSTSKKNKFEENSKFIKSISNDLKPNRKFHDKRIKKCLSQFEEKMIELARPFALLYNNKKIKKNILPKINTSVFTGLNFNE